MDAARFVFLDETGTATNMGRRYGRSPCGERLVAAVPQGHWKTTTFIAGLKQSGIVAPLVLDGPMTGPAFRAYVEQFLAPALEPGDVVVLDNLAAHKVAGVRQAIAAAGAAILYLPPYSPDLNPIEQAVRQAEGALAQGRGAHQGRTLAGHRPPPRQRVVRRMRELPQPLRLWFYLR
jgi:transposase